MSLYNEQRDRLLGKPSVNTEYCPFCGRRATNKHHVIPKGMGGTAHEKAIPTITVCGHGNTNGCHGRLHDHTLELNWDDETDWWKYRYPRAMNPEWKPLRKEEI